MAKRRCQKEQRSKDFAENTKAPQLQAAGPSEGRGSMLQALSSLKNALPVVNSVLTAIKTLLEVLQSLNNM